MNKALDNDCFFSALSLALTLPDICGKAKYPTDGNKKRYIAWYDEYVGAYEQCPGEEGEMPYLSGEVVYQLRCSFLHQGNPNIDKGKINEECCKIDKFVLLTEKKKEFNILSDSASSSEQFWGVRKSEIPTALTKLMYAGYALLFPRVPELITRIIQPYLTSLTSR